VIFTLSQFTSGEQKGKEFENSIRPPSGKTSFANLSKFSQTMENFGKPEVIFVKFAQWEIQ
jgi:hypothetical protein